MLKKKYDYNITILLSQTARQFKKLIIRLIYDRQFQYGDNKIR